MRERRIEKIYLAWVEGAPPENEGSLVHFLEHGAFRAHISKEGKESILYYKVLEKKKGLSLLEIHLVTGRYHQIRAQLAAIGCPILGDEKYGSKRGWAKGIALYHTEMHLMHPVTKNQIAFKLKGDFSTLDQP
jgi:23S rRNA pseudouridine1911/1915/1917 synthase